MPAVDMRSRRRTLLEAERRKDIVRAAEALILRRGFGRLTMDDLAREAQFSKATLYKYFRSKTEVVAAIFVNYFDRVRKRLERIRERKIGHAAQLREFIRAVLEMHEESRNFSQALMVDEEFMKKMGVLLADERRVPAEDRKFVRMMKDRLGALSAILEEFLAEGVRRGAFRATNPALTVRMLSVSLSAFAHRQPWQPVEVGVEEATEFIHQFFMHGLAPPRGRRKGETR